MAQPSSDDAAQQEADLIAAVQCLLEDHGYFEDTIMHLVADAVRGV